MRSIVMLILLAAAGCASQPGRDGPAQPTTSDTVRYPGDAEDPLDFPTVPGGGTLQSTTNLITGPWVEVPGFSTARLPADRKQEFFRVRVP